MCPSLKTANLRKLIALIELILVYGFLFNPWTAFPYTLIIIIIVVLLLTYLHDKNLAELGLKHRPNIAGSFKVALLLFLVIEPLLDFIVQPLSNKLTGEVTDYAAFQSLENNFYTYCKYVVYVFISAAIGEELLFRGFLFRQLSIMLPDNSLKPASKVILSAILFSLPHLYQGASGLIVTSIIGIIFALIYIKTNNLLITIILHALVDTMFLTLAYYDKLEYYKLANEMFWGY